MKKIPLHPVENLPGEPPSAPGTVPAALEILLLGGIWWHVLILLPLLQQLPVPTEWSVQVVKVQGLATAAITLVLLALRHLAAGADWRRQGRETATLAGMGMLAGVLVWQAQRGLPTDLHLYAAGLQAILALGYFMLRQPLPDSV